MADHSKIEWTDATFNPWIGCTKVSPACDHCYAAVSTPARTMGVEWGAGQPRRRTSDGNWKLPLRWNAKAFWQCNCGWRGHDLIGTENGRLCPVCRAAVTPARMRVFCASLADVFDNEVPTEWRADLFRLIALTPNLDWLLLTKRIGNAERMINEATWWPALAEGNAYKPRPNVWLGATICNQAEADRDIPKLLATPAAVRFLSMEPLLGPVDLESVLWRDGHRVDVLRRGYWNAAGYLAYGPSAELGAKRGGFTNHLDMPGQVDWVIVGGESGNEARPMHPDWARSLRDQCEGACVPFLFKQWGEWLGTQPTDPKPAEGTPCHEWNGGVCAWRVGKKAAGRHLDGVLHDGYPEVRHD